MASSATPDSPPPSNKPGHIVVMGGSGSGKSTIAPPVAKRIGLEFAEGDNFHTEENQEKMMAGLPLNDENRDPWLRAIVEWTQARHDAGRSTVVTCSALKRIYRDTLREGADATCFVHLFAPIGVLARRMERRDHFMPEELLKSQFDALEPLEDDELGFGVDVSPEINQVVATILKLFPHAGGGSGSAAGADDGGNSVTRSNRDRRGC